MRFLRLPDVEAKVGLKKTEIYRRIQKRDFPPPIRLGGASRWVEADIEAWMQQIIARARGGLQ